MVMVKTDKEVWNSYSVRFVFNYAVVTTTVFALHEDAAPDIAADLIAEDLGIKSEIFDTAQDIEVELAGIDVL